MPVLLVNADGTAEARFVTDRFSVDQIVGRAVIIHAKPDNYANIPTDRYDPDPDAITLATGDAGARQACGLIRAIERTVPGQLAGASLRARAAAAAEADLVPC